LNIELLTLCEVVGIKGEKGDFEVELLRRPRYVDMEKCIACGICFEKCPKKVVDEYNQGLIKRKAIYVPYQQAVPLKYAIDEEACIYLKKGKCKACEKFCPSGAINWEDREESITLRVGAVIVSSGFSSFDPSPYETYSYNSYANVVTSLEFERILSSTGPYQGHLKRPSDEQEPRKIAWLQCVGSRDINRCDNSYCSSVCCMYAIKEAVIAKEHVKGQLDTAIFFMDMRTYGKDFEMYYNRAKEEVGVRFIRSRIHSIEEDPKTQNLVLQYVSEDGNIRKESFDMVVLSTGMETSSEVRELTSRIGIHLSSDGFALTPTFAPVETTKEGIYVCGALQGPKDIPYSVMEASAAASKVKELLSSARGTQSKEKRFPEEKDVGSEAPRIGVFVCNCGTNIGGIVDVPAVAEYARSLPGVVYVEENLFSCSQDTQDKMREVIQREGLNRIVVAACSPRTHEPLFQETVQAAGLNKYLFEMANIRNQCSWVHSDEKEEATRKAKDLVRMAVARANLIKPISEPRISVIPSALVVGGGVSGMAAALSLAAQGFEVYLVERLETLGGNATRLARTWQGEDIYSHVTQMVDAVENHSLIKVYKNTQIKHSSGFVGNYETVLLREGGKEETVKHGAVILAVGAKEFKPNEYLYGQDPSVLTHLELSEALRTSEHKVVDANRVVFIQCVGSREPERPYCSKVCCTHTMEAAIQLKEMGPEKDIYVLYRDIRTYGERERLYREAREKGVIFIRYDMKNKPQVVREKGVLLVRCKDHILDREILIEADVVALATAIVPNDYEKIAKAFKVPLNQDGFFMEAHAKLRPVEFATDGIFVAGLCHYPKPIEESIAQGQAAASRASVILSKSEITVEGMVSHVNELLCRGCGECEGACPFGAIEVQEEADGTKKAKVKEALCKGCGACAVACPTGAAGLYHAEDTQVMSMVEAALKG